MILIYSKKGSKRLAYILDFLFIDILKTSYSITHNPRDRESHEGPYISYSAEKMDTGIHIPDSEFLYEKGVRTFNPDIRSTEDSIQLFPSETGDLRFDVFAASFYLLSRYEEYQNHIPDKHGRFPAEISLAYKFNFLQRPIIDEWAIEIKKLILQKYPGFVFPDKQTTLLSTFDIDQAYYLKHKSFLRIVNSFVRSLLTADWKSVQTKIEILRDKISDPYDTIEKAEALHHQYGIKASYFFLMAEQFTRKDINIYIQNKAFTTAIGKLSEKANIGIHPSYSSYLNVSMIRREKRSLELIIDKPITASRQHFLRMTLPKTYQSLLKSGIKEDYTMGYASQTGFRAGTCTPFKFYDLSDESINDLLIYPFCVMDTSFSSYLNYNPEEALAQIEKLIIAVNAVKGTFSSLWHNESLSGYKYWEGWACVYEKMLSLFFKYHSDGTYTLKK